MNKKEAIATLKEKYGFDTKQAEVHLNLVLDLISEGLFSDTREFNISGWGKLYCVDKPARKGRNPSTGAEIDIAATTVVKWKVGSKLKQSIKDGKILKLSKD